MRTWSGLSANRMLAGMTRGAPEATRPGQFSRISGLVGCCAGARSCANSATPTASVTIIDRRTRPAMRCSCARRSNTVARFGRPDYLTFAHRTFAPSAPTQNAPLARGIVCSLRSRSARRADDAAGRDHHPAAVLLLLDRMYAAEARNVVACFHFERAVAGSLDQRRVAIDVAHGPAGHGAHSLGRRLRRLHGAGGVLGRERVEPLLDPVEALEDRGLLPVRTAVAADAARALIVGFEYRDIVLQLHDRAPHGAGLIHLRGHGRGFGHLRELRVLQESKRAEGAAGGADRDRDRDRRSARDLLANRRGRRRGAVVGLRCLLACGWRGGCGARPRRAAATRHHTPSPLLMVDELETMAVTKRLQITTSTINIWYQLETPNCPRSWRP